jgi:hypothetical protein
MEKNRAGEREWGFFGDSGAGREPCAHCALCDLRAIHVDFASTMAIVLQWSEHMVLA